MQEQTSAQSGQEAEGAQVAQRRYRFGVIWAVIRGARAPISVIVFYGAILFLPDQSAELIRAVFQADYWQQVVVLALWLFLAIYLGWACRSSAILGFVRERQLARALTDFENRSYFLLRLCSCGNRLSTVAD